MDRILQILKELHPERDYEGSADFLEDGLIESLDIILLISKLEEEYNISLDFSQMGPDDFVSKEAIFNLIGQVKE